MGFWTSQRISAENKRLQSDSPYIVDGKGIGLISNFCESSVDCNAYTLKIGREYYVSPVAGSDDAPTRSIKSLTEDEAFQIPPGQFAFLTTEEYVRIPPAAMAFISIKAGLKFRGLINASGFHVDPGFRGALVFSVFNAGPQPVHLKRGMDAFLIWFADLCDSADVAESVKRKKDDEKNGKRGINPDVVTKIAGEIHSFEGLNSRIKATEKSLSDRMHAIEKEQAITKWAAVGIFGAVIGALIKHAF